MFNNDEDKVINFAKKYAGQNVYIINRENNAIDVTARIIGYYKDMGHNLLVDFPDHPTRQKDCWEIKNDSFCVMTTTESVKYAWSVELKFVKAIVECKPYPHICKSCRAPARRNKDATICSNVSCKSRRKYVRSFNKGIVKKVIAKDNIIRCVVCNMIEMIKITSVKKRGIVHTDFNLQCLNGHVFNIVPKIGSVVYLPSDQHSSYTYNGSVFAYNK